MHVDDSIFVPQTGSAKLSGDHKAHPFATGWQRECQLFLRRSRETRPGILVCGKQYIAALRCRVVSQDNGHRISTASAGSQPGKASRWSPSDVIIVGRLRIHYDLNIAGNGGMAR